LDLYMYVQTCTENTKQKMGLVWGVISKNEGRHTGKRTLNSFVFVALRF
jgi:hypothetical protein